MNGWLTAGTLLLAVLAPVLWSAASGPVPRRIAAQNLATTLVALAVLFLAQGYRRPAYVDVSLVVAVLGPAGSLVYARLLDEEMPARSAGAGVRAVSVSNYVLVPAVVAALLPVTTPGRALGKLLVIGVLLVAGSAVVSGAVSGRKAGSSVSDE